MASIFRSVSHLFRRSPLQPRIFANENFERINPAQKVEEEALPDYMASRYYPVRIGEVLVSRYQVVGKLGFGATSTVWLAQDLNTHGHVAVKIFIHSKSLGSLVGYELSIYKKLQSGSSRHPGATAVRTLLDSFWITGPDGDHQCLVHPPLWDSVRTLLARNPIGRLPKPVLGIVLKRLFLALDFMHSECQLIHTDIKADNIMFGINDDSVFEEFEEEELQNPCPRKEVEGRWIYTSRELRRPTRYGPPVLCDFGSTISGEKEHIQDVQPDIYRSPEVILQAPWQYKIDIWNAGCMIWDIFEGGHLFYGTDPEYKQYRSRAHLAEIMALLGPPPPELLVRGTIAKKFFTEDGTFQAGIDLRPSVSLEELETNLEGAEKEKFMILMKKMLQWMPEDRSTAKELSEDSWINETLGG